MQHQPQQHHHQQGGGTGGVQKPAQRLRVLNGQGNDYNIPGLSAQRHQKRRP